jgi:SAM-dependent methyltransferase
MTSSADHLLPNSRDWFDAVDEAGLRGLRGQAGCIHYADYILQAIRPGPGTRVVDLGCGDGGVAQAMAIMRPDVQIEGWDFSGQQIEKARAACAGLQNIKFRQIDLKSPIPSGEPAGHFFSFSVIQYFSVGEFAALNTSLRGHLAPGGTISHLSIPDLGKRALLFQADWLDRGSTSPLKASVQFLKMLAVDAKRRMAGDRRYGNSLFHDPAELARSAPQTMATKITRPSDSWYRFDIHLH